MESHPYTKPRGVGPVTTELTPGAEPTAAQTSTALFVSAHRFRPNYKPLSISFRHIPGTLSRPAHSRL